MTSRWTERDDFGPNTSRSTERAVTEPSFRDTSVGMRVCADIQ